MKNKKVPSTSNSSLPQTTDPQNQKAPYIPHKMDQVADRKQDEEQDNMYKIMSDDAAISASRFDDDEENADDAYHAVEKESKEEQGVHEEDSKPLDD